MAKAKGTSNFIQPVSRYTSWLNCLLHLHQELGRVGQSADDLEYHQREILHGLTRALDESAIASLHDWWNYDLDRLRKPEGHVRPAKPRIELRFRINQRDNFTLEWEPSDVRLGRPAKGCDWLRWWNTGPSFGGRPSNELMYVKEVGAAAHRISRADTPMISDDDPLFVRSPAVREQLKRDRARYRYRREGRAVDAILLRAVTSLVDDLKVRLALNFEVRMVNEIVEVWEASARGPRALPDRLLSWEVGHVEERTRKEELAEFEKLRGICPVETLASAWAETITKRTGPQPSGDTKPERVSKRLKKAGHSGMTPSVVRRYAHLLDKFQPQALPKPPPDPTRVVPFKKRDSDG